MSAWHVLSAAADVNLSMTLCGGQCFRWRRTERNTWVGVIGRKAFELCASARAPSHHHHHCEISLKADATVRRPSLKTPCASLWFRCLNEKLKSAWEVTREKRFLHHYLALDVDLDSLWTQWTVGNSRKAHPLVRHLTESATKEVPVRIRVLRQDLHETLLSFLCSQNNNVKRITELVDTLAVEYGDFICYFDLCSGNVFYDPTDIQKSNGLTGNKCIALYSLPNIEQMSTCTEADLRAKGFGYRSRYLAHFSTFVKSAGGVNGKRFVSNESRGKSPQWYDALRHRALSLRERREKLMALTGVGRKVADCVLLFALGHYELVPVDTHMAQVAAEFLGKREKDVSAEKKVGRQRKRARGINEESAENDWEFVLAAWANKAKGNVKQKHVLQPKHHDAIQEGFRILFGDYCGWAHSILFYNRMRKIKY